MPFQGQVDGSCRAGPLYPLYPFCLLHFLATERGIQSLTIFMDLSVLSVLSVFILCILTLCCEEHTHLGLLCVLGELTFFHYVMPVFIFDNFPVLKSALSKLIWL